MATGLAGRYATALFDLAREAGQIDAVSADLAKLRTALAQSDDFRALTTSPMISRDAAAKAALATAEAMKLDGDTRNFIVDLARNRRLAGLPQIITALEALASQQRGKINAEVTAAHPTTKK